MRAKWTSVLGVLAVWGASGCGNVEICEVFPEACDPPPDVVGSCTFTDAGTTTGDHLGYGQYANPAASSGTECVCTFDEVNALSYAEITGVTVELSGARSQQVAFQPAWSGTSGRAALDSTAPWSASMAEWNSDVDVASDGTYTVWASTIANDPTVPDDEHEVECSEFGTATWSIGVGTVSEPTARRRRETASGRRLDAIDCIPGQQVTATFALGLQPGLPTLVPLHESGPARFAGIDIRSVQVVDFRGAGEVRLSGGPGDTVVMRPGRPLAQLVPGRMFLHGARWGVRNSAPGSTQLPLVRVTGVCPPLSQQPPRIVSESYVLDRRSNLFATPTRYLLSLEPGAQGPDMHLMLNVEGVDAMHGLPLTSVGPERWRVDSDHPVFSAHGYVERRQGLLVLDFEQARWGDEELGVVHLEVPAY